MRVLVLAVFALVSLFYSADSFLISLRLPRILAAIVVGGMLGVSGALMQSVLKNPLASPFTLGVTHGAMFGVSLAIVVLGGEFIFLSAFLGAVLVMALIISFSKNLSKEALILAGVAINAVFTSFAMFLEYFASEIELSNIINWSFGDLSKAEYLNVLVSFLALVVVLFIVSVKIWDFKALEIEESENVGVDVKKVTFLALILATLLSALSVSYFGIIGFVGLIGPYFARVFYRGYDKFFFDSAIFGAIILVVSDFFARNLLYPIELPVGIVTSFIGGVVFLMILRKRSEVNY